MRLFNTIKGLRLNFLQLLFGVACGQSYFIVREDQSSEIAEACEWVWYVLNLAAVRLGIILNVCQSLRHAHSIDAPRDIDCRGRLNAESLSRRLLLLHYIEPSICLAHALGHRQLLAT